MATVREFPVILMWDSADNIWNVSVPAIPGCFTWGVTLDEALRHAEEAIDLNLEDIESRGEVIPEPQRLMIGTIRG